MPIFLSIHLHGLHLDDTQYGQTWHLSTQLRLASVVNHTIVTDPTIQQPGFNLPHHMVSDEPFPDRSRILLNVCKCCVTKSDVKKYRTFTCLVLNETVNRTLYQKMDGPVKYRTPDNHSYDTHRQIENCSRDESLPGQRQQWMEVINRHLILAFPTTRHKIFFQHLANVPNYFKSGHQR